MKKTGGLIIMAVTIALALPAIASATPPQMGAYFSGFMGVSVPRDNRVTTDDFPFAPIEDRVEFDPGINIGATGGFDFGLVRLEGELSYRQSEIKSITEQGSGIRFSHPDGDLGVGAFMFNTFFDLHNDSIVTPYLGGGVGFATLFLSDTFGTDTSTGVRTRLYDEGDDTVFAYQVGGGLEIALNRHFSLDLGYRYFGTETASINSDSLFVNSLKYESHNGSVGFRLKF